MNFQSLQIPKPKIDSFRENSYVRLPGFFSPEIVESLRRMSDEMSSQACSILRLSRVAGESMARLAQAHPSELIVVQEAADPTRVCKYEFMIGANSSFRSFATNYVQSAISQVMGCDVVPFKDKTNEKLPGGGAFRPHQDSAAYQFFKPSYYITALLTIDASTTLNGCLNFATNFHQLVRTRPNFVAERIEGHALLPSINGGPNHGDIRPDIVDAVRWEPVALSPADLVIFDSYIPHFSEGNKSTAPRRAIFVTYNLASEGSFYNQYYAEKRANYDDPKFHVATPTSHRDVQVQSEPIRKAS
jgi:ectoine hydroxylase-related dioxygenase (phytanoyl-CoA dioxygenase family)